MSRKPTSLRILVTIAIALSVGTGVIGGGRAVAGPVAAGRAAPVVNTANGVLRGVSRGDVDSFLGIPFAKAPIGPLRWEPPQPAVRWRGVRAATSYGNRCPELPSQDGPLSLTEDCLFLNVQRPADTEADGRLPVYVFIHGGGNFQGSSDNFDGTNIVQQTGIIVVTINYRLGVFGWLGHPALTREQGESGNYGFQDEQAALRWVHRNIAAFGGDADRVTIGGQSSGGGSACALLTAPATLGLFAAAIIQSADCSDESQADSEAAGIGVAATVGCTDVGTALACLRGLDTATLLNAAPGFAGVMVSGTPTLPLSPVTAIAQGRFAHVPVIIGTTRDEARTFTRQLVGITQADYTAAIQANYPPAVAPQVLAHYPWPAQADQFTGAYLTAAQFTDGFISCPTLKFLEDSFARYTNTRVYEFDHRNGPGLRPDPVGYVWGAGHAAELAYLWPSFNNGIPIAPTFNAAERQLATEMVQYWGAFVRNGDPRVSGQARWPRFDRTNKILSLRAGDDTTTITEAAFQQEHQCGFWGGL